jgi:hypothetical protein
MALGKLIGFVIVAAGAVTRRYDRAVTRRYDRRNLDSVMQIAIGILKRGLVALYTPHTLLGVGAALPVCDDAGVLLGVAFHALP